MGTIANTTYGQLEGIDDDGVVRFKGIPFAKPPVGELRFRAPQPPEKWDGVRPATRSGTVSMQSPSPLDAMFAQEPEPMDEDCLYLNIVTPAVDDARRPVLVWIHGGGFIMGSGSSPMYDGVSFARRGDVVFVSINYRLGELGFLYLGEADEAYRTSGNNGILDQVAALEWVRDNIASFGGDPGNVTIFGESAGGMSVGTLLAVPAAKGLFHRAIAQSGAARNVLPSKVAAEVADDFMSRVQARTVGELVEVPAEKLLEARGQLLIEAMSNVDGVVDGDGPLLGLPFQPVVDGAVVPDSVLEVIRDGEGARVPLLVGTTRDEWKLFGLMDFGDLDAEKLERRADAVVGDGATFVETYAASNPGAGPKEIFGELATDYAFRIPAIRMAEAQGQVEPGVWMYLFDWKSRALGGLLGACHGMELPFVFHNVDQPQMEAFLGAGPAPSELADQVQDAWIAFARTGDPNHPGLPEWPAYEPGRRATMEFAEPCRVVDDPMASERKLWETVI